MIVRSGFFEGRMIHSSASVGVRGVSDGGGGGGDPPPDPEAFEFVGGDDFQFVDDSQFEFLE